MLISAMNESEVVIRGVVVITKGIEVVVLLRFIINCTLHTCKIKLIPSDL